MGILPFDGDCQYFATETLINRPRSADRFCSLSSNSADNTCVFTNRTMVHDISIYYGSFIIKQFALKSNAGSIVLRSLVNFSKLGGSRGSVPRTLVNCTLIRFRTTKDTGLCLMAFNDGITTT